MHLDPARKAMVERLKPQGRPKGSKNREARRVPNLSESPTAADESARWPPSGSHSPASPGIGSSPHEALHTLASAAAAPPRSVFLASASTHPPSPRGDLAALDAPCLWDHSAHAAVLCAHSPPTANAPRPSPAQAVQDLTAPLFFGSTAPSWPLPAAGHHRWAGSASDSASDGWAVALPSLHQRQLPTPPRPQSPPVISCSSRADDPFHDDWRYWPKEGGTGS
jgi:hypothetical protein